MSGSEEALLRRAAKTVREYARDTTIGRRYSADAHTHLTHAPWSAWPSCEFDEDEPEFAAEIAKGASGVIVEVAGGVQGITDRTPNWRDARWIAFASPALAEPLAAWLEFGADLSRHAVENGGPPDLGGSGHALAVARVLLGVSAVPAPVGDDHQEEK